MKKNDIRVEMPSHAGNEIQFFLQCNPKNTCSCNAHIHNAVEMLYIREGSYIVTLDDSRYEIGEGDLILFCSGAVHHVVTGECEKNSYYVIKIPPTFFVGLAKGDMGAEYAMRFALNRKESKCLWRREALLGSDIQYVLDMLVDEYTQNKYASDVAVRLKVMELMLAVLRDDLPSRSGENASTIQLIYSVMRYIQDNYAEDIDEQELAKRYGMSYSYFSRSFKRVTGMTFKAYLNRTRISKAEQLLLQHGGSVTEVATACGYNSISYFISVYRSITGKTPYKAMKAETEQR